MARLHRVALHHAAIDRNSLLAGVLAQAARVASPHEKILTPAAMGVCLPRNAP